MQTSSLPTYNYLVPADGTTHVVTANLDLTGSAVELDWSTFQQQNFKFYPQGAYINNLQGTEALTLSIPAIGFVVNVPAGASQNVGFPSPANCVMQVVGQNPAAVINFVDYPLITGAPVTSAGTPAGSAVSITNSPLDVADLAVEAIITAFGSPAANALAVQTAAPAITVSTPLNASAATGISSAVSMVNQRDGQAFVSATVAATGNLQVSPDGTNWYNAATINFSAAGSAVFPIPAGLNSVRFDILTNTGAVTAQVASIANNGFQS